MYNFFVDKSNVNNTTAVISGNDFNHIKNVLRMRVGDEFLISVDGVSSLCKLSAFENDSVIAEIIAENYLDTKLPIEIYLFQGLPKSDKMELIIQKAVELGVNKIIPVEMKRCVVKLDGKNKVSKVSRWQLIAESAAKQSKRNEIPRVLDVLTYNQALEMAKELDLFIVPYENKNGMQSTLSALKEIKKGYKVGVLIGPEGGFEDSEAKLSESFGGKLISLGKRILRAETASITALSMLMLYAEMNIE